MGYGSPNMPLSHLPPELTNHLVSAPTEQNRPQHQQRSSHNFALGTFDKPRSIDNPLLDQTNRRPGLDRHTSRNSANSQYYLRNV
jgi:hypothetical protein